MSARAAPTGNGSRSEDIPLVESFFVENVATVPLEPWKRTGGLGVHLCLEGTGETNDTYICEIPPGKSLTPEKHMYEELIYVISGRGAATVWNEGEPKRTFEWQEGSLFSPPLNIWHEIFNGNGSQKYHEMWGEGRSKADVDVKLGGNQVEYEDEDPIVGKMFSQACARAGVSNLMGKYYTAT